MPIYEYQCEACSHQLEALQKLSDEPLQMCPSCQQPRLRKQISAAGFRLKGGGWYETDFKKSGQKNLAEGGKGGDSVGSGGDKPASAPAAAPAAPATAD